MPHNRQKGRTYAADSASGERVLCTQNIEHKPAGNSQQLHKSKQVPPLQPRPTGAMETYVFRKRMDEADAQQPDILPQRNPQAGGVNPSVFAGVPPVPTAQLSLDR